MSEIARWRGFSWGISGRSVRSITSFSTGYKIKKVADEDGNGKVMGHELQIISLSYDVAFAVGVNPRAEYECMCAVVGQRAPFYLGGRRFGPRRVQLDEVGIDGILMDNAGTFLKASISLSFVEYSTGSDDDEMKIIYQGVDIYGEISLNQCVHDMYAASRSDELTIKFNDPKKLWDGWSPKSNDTIEVICGSAITGKMPIESVKPENGVMVLRALSIPLTAKNKSNKSWEKIKLSQLGKEIADRHKLKFQTFELKDQTYAYVSQVNIPDFVFLEYRCSLEGVAFLVFDGTLVMYDEKAMESQAPIETIKVGSDGKYEYKNDATEIYGRCEVANSQFVGIFDAKNGTDKLLREVLKLQTGNQAEANRFAKGRLRYHNKNTVSGTLETSMLRQYAAGSVVDVKTTGAGSWDGSAFIYHLRHDYVNEKSKIFFRKPLEGY